VPWKLSSELHFLPLPGTARISMSELISPTWRSRRGWGLQCACPACWEVAVAQGKATHWPFELPTWPHLDLLNTWFIQTPNNLLAIRGPCQTQAWCLFDP
jgi:hypothetical protein